MGRPGSALDNAVIESWHSTLEFELRRVEHYATRAAARAGVAAQDKEAASPPLSFTIGLPRFQAGDAPRNGTGPPLRRQARL